MVKISKLFRVINLCEHMLLENVYDSMSNEFARKLKVVNTARAIRNVIYISVYTKCITMCPPGYHHSKMTPALGTQDVRLYICIHIY